MSVNREDYVMIGADLINVYRKLEEREEVEDIDAYDELEKLKEKAEKEQQLDCIKDYMDDEYFVVGKIITKCDEGSGFRFTSINPKTYENTINIIKSKIKLVFDVDADVNIIVFTDWR